MNYARGFLELVIALPRAFAASIMSCAGFPAAQRTLRCYVF